MKNKKQTNEIEVIDGVRGEWRTVTKASEVTYGQQIRWVIGFAKGGFKTTQRFNGFSSALFNEETKIVQAFFPLPSAPVRKARKARKVAKVYTDIGEWDDTICRILMGKFWIILNGEYCNRKSAIRGARRFCAAIGYECEIVKEGK